MTTTFTEIPIPEDGASPFIAWMDWNGTDVLRLFHERSIIDVIHWGITDAEQFEKAKRQEDGRNRRALCVTGKYPVEEMGELVDSP